MAFRTLDVFFFNHVLIFPPRPVYMPSDYTILDASEQEVVQPTATIIGRKLDVQLQIGLLDGNKGSGPE